jgi:hypothetical protein
MTDKIGSPNQQCDVKFNVAALQQEWHKKIRVRIHAVRHVRLRHVERQIKLVFRTNSAM